MKYLITTLILIYSHSSMSTDHKTIEGEMTCVITNQNVIDQKDGKVTQYSGHKNIEIGDKLNFKYYGRIGSSDCLTFIY